jgi:hypothetical protein
MGRCIRERVGNRGGKGFGAESGRGNYDNQWDRENPDPGPCRDVRDIYEDQPDPASDEYLWPDNEDEDEED